MLDPTEAQAGDGEMFPPVEDLFTVDGLGGWDALNDVVFGADGVFTKAFEDSQG